MDTEPGRSTPEGTVIGEDTGPQRPMQVPQRPALTCYMLPSLSQAVHFPLVLAAKIFFWGERVYCFKDIYILSTLPPHKRARPSGPTCVQNTKEQHALPSHVPCEQPCQPAPLPSIWGAEGPQLTRTFLLGDQVLHNDIRHAIPVGIAVLVEPVHCAENQLVEGNGAILAAHHLWRASVSVLSLLRRTDRPHLPVRNKRQRFHWLNTTDVY